MLALLSVTARMSSGTERRRPANALQHYTDDARWSVEKGKGSQYSITERRVPELIPVLGSQPAADVSHEPGSRLPLLSARPTIKFATLKTADTYFAAW